MYTYQTCKWPVPQLPVLIFNGTEAALTPPASYLGGSGGLLPQKILENKEQNTAIWDCLGGFGYT